MKAIVNTFKEFSYISWPSWKETFSKTFVVIVFSFLVGIISALVVSTFVPFFGGLK